MVKAREAAQILGGISVRQFYRLAVPFVRLTVNGDRLWDVRDLEAFAERRKSRKIYLRAVRVAGPRRPKAHREDKPK